MSDPKVTSILALVRAAYQQGFERHADEDVQFEVGMMPLPGQTPGQILGTLVIYACIRGPEIGSMIQLSRFTELGGPMVVQPDTVDHHVTELLAGLREGRSQMLVELRDKATAQPAGSGPDPDLGKLLNGYAHGS